MNIEGHKAYYNSIKNSANCYVCGKYIPMFQGKIVHRGECLKIYQNAVSRYFWEKRKASLI